MAKIYESLQESFSQLQGNLASGLLKKVIAAKPQNLHEEDEVYTYAIPLLNSSGSLTFNYDDFYSEFSFKLEMPVAKNQGFAFYDSWMEMEDEEEAHWEYESGDDHDTVLVSKNLERSWKRQSARMLSNMEECSELVWNFWKKLEKGAAKKADQSDKEYAAFNNFIKGIVSHAAESKPAIVAPDGDNNCYFSPNDEYCLTLDFEAVTKPHHPQLAISFYPDENTFVILSIANRHGLKKTACETLATAFLEDEEGIEFLSADGRGEEADFTFYMSLEISRESLSSQNSAKIAAAVARLYKKTEEFAKLVKENPAISLNDIKPIPAECQSFEDFWPLLYKELTANTIKGLTALPIGRQKLVWSQEKNFLEMSFPIEGDIFLLKLKLSVYNYLQADFYGYRFGATANEMKDAWEDLADDVCRTVKGVGRGEKAYFILSQPIQAYDDQDRTEIGDFQNILSMEALIRELGQFFAKASLLAKELKKAGKIRKAEAEAEIDKLRKELAPASEPARQAFPGVATIKPIERRESAEMALPEFGDNEEKETDSSGQEGMAAHVEEESVAESAGFSDADKASLSAIADSLLEILKQNEELRNALPDSVGEVSIINNRLVVLLPVANTPLFLRVRFDPEEQTLDAGWIGSFKWSMLGKCRKDGEKLKKKIGVNFFINVEEFHFSFFKQEDAKGKHPKLEKVEDLGKKVRHIYQPVLQYSRMMSE